MRHALNVRHVAFSADGRLLLTACWDKAARGWDVSPTAWPVEDVAMFAAIASPSRVAPGPTPKPLSGAELDDRLKTLRLAPRVVRGAVIQNRTVSQNPAPRGRKFPCSATAPPQ